MELSNYRDKGDIIVRMDMVNGQYSFTHVPKYPKAGKTIVVGCFGNIPTWQMQLNASRINMVPQ